MLIIVKNNFGKKFNNFIKISDKTKIKDKEFNSEEFNNFYEKPKENNGEPEENISQDQDYLGEKLAKQCQEEQDFLGNGSQEQQWGELLGNLSYLDN